MFSHQAKKKDANLNFLSMEEEQDVLGYFEVKLAEFCTKFKVE